MTKPPKSRRSAKTKVVSAHSKTSKLRHFSLVHHKHSGKVVGHSHTSYFGLAIILAIVGLVLHSTQGVWATPPPVSHTVGITAHVNGPPPTEGATIAMPADGAIFTDQQIIEIDGTCAADTSVVLSSNANVVGSATCTPEGTFTMNVQLDYGTNVLSARNYDTDNQAGPDTADVTVTLKQTPPPANSGTATAPPESGALSEPAAAEEEVVIPKDTSPFAVEEEPNQDPCANQDTPELPTGVAKPKVAITCIPRVFKAGIQYSIQVAVWGGKGPYAIDVDWGDNKTPHSLVSMESAGYKTISIVYDTAGSYTIKVNVRDNDGLAAYVEAAATVPGDTSPIAVVSSAIAKSNIFTSPVPAYTTAVTLVAGFWASQAFTHFVTGPAGAHALQHFRPRHKLIKH